LVVLRRIRRGRLPDEAAPYHTYFSCSTCFAYSTQRARGCAGTKRAATASLGATGVLRGESDADYFLERLMRVRFSTIAIAAVFLALILSFVIVFR
jgi:hypothetical protein